MQFTQQFSIIGAVGNKGKMDNGLEYDYTRLIVLMPVSPTKGERAVGSNSKPVPYGLSDNFDKFKGRQYPFNATCDCIMTTDGLEFLSVKIDPVTK